MRRLVWILSCLPICFLGCSPKNCGVFCDVIDVSLAGDSSVMKVECFAAMSGHRKVLFSTTLEQAGGYAIVKGPVLSPNDRYSLFNMIDGEGGALLIIDNKSFKISKCYGGDDYLGCCCPIWFSDSKRVLFFGLSPIGEGAFVYDVKTGELEKRMDLWDIPTPDCRYLPEWITEDVVLRIAFPDFGREGGAGSDYEVVYRDYDLESKKFVSEAEDHRQDSVGDTPID